MASLPYQPVDPLGGYAPAGGMGSDIFTASPPAIAQGWRAFAAGLVAQGNGDLAQAQAHIDRQVSDLGLAFRITGDEQERVWPLGPMPLLIGAEEWQGIADGLIQRARLLEAVLADLHGPRRLITEGHLPAPVVAGSDNFMERMAGLTPPGGHFLYVLAVDLARGSDGVWRVLADRGRLPMGIGYALENRMALARATGGLLAQIGARRLSDFFEAMRAGIAASCARSEPRIGLLTPGRFHQSYPEQAHLARHLGFSLVEGCDLVVSDERLYVRTIEGLKRIDALWRWINARDIDPLAFDPASTIGVPDLASAWEQGGLVVANWPGAGVMESRAMAAFLPYLSKVLLAEKLALPGPRTWWCGQDDARAYTLAHLDELAIGPAFRTPVDGLLDGATRLGASLSPTERDELLAAIARRPMDFAAQEIIHASTTPCLIGCGFEPRPFTLRAFVARDAEGNWEVMSGGFARVSTQGDLRIALMGAGDVSADVCVVETARPEQLLVPLTLTAPPLHRAEGLLPSQSADNLFWLGRYCERAQMIARVIRTLLASATDGDATGGSVAPRLAALLARLDAVPHPPDEDEDEPDHLDLAPTQLAAIALAGPDQAGSLAQVVESARHAGRLLRDRLTPDCWRVLNRPLQPPQTGHGRPDDAEAIADAADRIIERFAALCQLLSDHMSRGPAWRFLDMGRALERASLAVQAAETLIPGHASADDLAALLELFDADHLYRSRYLAMPFITPVLDLVLLDRAQPRSLAFQVALLGEHLAALPTLGENGLPQPPLLLARRLIAELEALEAEEISPLRLSEIAAALAAVSDAITTRFFQQADRSDPPPAAPLQA
jgi:uncharacterized circularly permuted ATP-grasp superfamily protein/uncharacterized alpha-E superfamily protein